LISSARTRFELRRELALLLVVDDRAHEVGGQQVRRELDPRELGVDGVAERAHGQRLGQAGYPLEQDMAPREEADQDSLDHVLLADDDFADLALEAGDKGTLLGNELVQGADVVHGAKSLSGSTGKRTIAARRSITARPKSCGCAGPRRATRLVYS
jgi:hypothetical protein